MGDRVLRVLFLCTGNSARSVLAEALLGRLGEGRVEACSAGSHPTGAVHPGTLECLSARDYDVSGFASKSWDVFAGADAPTIDVVITVCDSARGETCPIWPGHPVSAHWGVDDPAAFDGPDDARRAVFDRAYDALERRIRRLVALPVEQLAPAELKRELDAIAAAGGAA